METCGLTSLGQMNAVTVSEMTVELAGSSLKTLRFAALNSGFPSR